ncbi:MAG: 50S ribosomal protein L4 [Microbacteriaceae bacterium]|jgi:large subunit ribosomal protein L4|nr:50S ribosomal protein L4 [Microbacteriaceae bacterium]MCI1206931.1 50S ribosomal protein L4 [Microbacteriaceae bacterium]
MSAATLDVVDFEGNVTGSVSLPPEIFDVDANIPLMHQVVVAQLAAARQGTSKVKTRAEVSGAGRKPFKQKGTGRARQGSIRAPQMRGGGTVHGPVPRSYAQRTPKKMVAAALRGALSDRARASRIHVATAFSAAEAPSTKSAEALFTAIAPGRGVLAVVTAADVTASKSVRNLATAQVIEVGQLNAYDVLVADDVVFTADAFDQFLTGNLVVAEAAEGE